MTGTILAMSDLGHVAAGWTAAFGGIGAYAIVVIRRGRRLSRVVPAEERRWS